MIAVQVRFFGGSHLFTRRLNPEIERALPTVTLPDGATVNDLLALLNIPVREGRPLVSINHYYCRDNAPLSDGDRIQLLKTVVGG
jgi:sulfur carrier protein ThiS